MTWTKLGDEFTAECGNVELSDAAFRTHVEIIAWLYRVEQMSLKVSKTRLPKVLESEHADTAMRELLSHGWYRDHGSEYELLHHADVIRQSIVAQEKSRTRSKKSSATFRERKQGDSEVTGHVTGHVTANADRQTDKQLGDGGSETDLSYVHSEECEHGRTWGCLDCKRARESA